MANTSYVYLINPTFQFMNVSGKPLVDGYVNLYISGTRSKYYAFSDFEGTLHPFNIPLNALGSAVILVSPAHSYDIYVYNALGTLQMSRYNITPATGEGTVITDVTTLTSKDGTVDITANSSTDYDLSIATKIAELKQYTDQAKNDAIESANTSIAELDDRKKDKQNELNFNGSATKTVKKITQDANGVINVEYEDISAGGISAGKAIDLTNNAVSVKYSNGLEVNASNELQVKAGAGLIFDDNSDVKVSIGEGLFLTADGKLTTKEPEDNFIDITNEWVFVNGFRLQYAGQYPGYGNDMKIIYSPVSDTVKFTNGGRVNRASGISIYAWTVMMQYKGDRFYTTYNAPDSSKFPILLSNDLLIGADSGGTTDSSLVKFGYVGSPSSNESDCGIAIQKFIGNDTYIYGVNLNGTVFKVFKKV